MGQPQTPQASTGGGWRNAHQNAYGLTVYSENYDGTVNLTGVYFPDGTYQSTAASGSAAWSSLTNPSGNLSLSMGANTSTFTYNAATGANDLFNLTDALNNTGTGAIFSITKASGSAMIGLRVKQLNNNPTQPLVRLENSNAAVALEFHTNDIAGTGTNRVEATGGSLMFTRGGTATANTLLQFTDTSTSKWLGIITSNFDGITSSEVGLTVNNLQTMSGTSTAAVLSVQNNGTRLLDVSPTATNIKSGALIVATAHTPATSGAAGTTGQIAWDSGFIYVCIATNTWGRAALSTAF